MIVVVEGPSAAGKTSWCRRHAPSFVGEHAGGQKLPTDPEALARHWVTVDSQRWAQALDLEAAAGIAVCDTDPVKLHYTWGLVRLGLAAPAQFERELAATRDAFAAGVLGFADVVLIGLPDDATLRRQRDGDPTRSRRNFDTHVRLRDPLADWYRALDGVDPGRVIWDLPPTGLPVDLPAPRAARSATALLTALTDFLP
jgi:hypothetical protein